MSNISLIFSFLGMSSNYRRKRMKPIPISKQNRKVDITKTGNAGSRALSCRFHTITRCTMYRGAVSTNR